MPLSVSLGIRQPTLDDALRAFLRAAQPWSLMVLHDLPTGAMDHLERFIDRAEKAGVRFRQDFPPECVPIRSGKIVRSIDSYVSSIEESAHS